MNDRLYIAEVKSDDIKSRVLLNGWPLMRHEEHGPLFLGKKLNPWLVEGENTIAVELAALTPGAPAPEAGFYIHVYVTDEGREMTDDDILCVYRWTPVESPLPLPGEASPRRVFTQKLRMAEAFGRFGWEDATPFQPADRDDVLRLLDALRSAFSRRDIPAILALLRTKHEEMGRALGVPVDRMERQTSTLYGDFYFTDQDNPFELAPYNADDIRLNPWSGGRLVELAHVEWPHPIIGRSDYRFGYDLTVSKVNGEWRIVR